MIHVIRHHQTPTKRRTLPKSFHACKQYSYNTSATKYLKSVCQQLQEIRQPRSRHNQPDTMFPHLIRAKYHHITLSQ